MSDALLRELAEAGGIAVHWHDAHGTYRTVAPDVLRALLAALGLPAGSASQAQESLAHIRYEQLSGTLPPLVTAEVDAPIRLRARPGRQRYRLRIEDDGTIEGETETGDDGFATLPAVGRTGYHALELGDQAATVAVAPRRCFAIADVTRKHLFGIGVQLYGLRRPGDGGAGDFSALADFVRSAARHGAGAVAISPVHAGFAADPARYSPYGPSSRIFLNGLLADPAEAFGKAAVARAAEAAGVADERQRLESEPLIDWDGVFRTRLALLRALFEKIPQKLAEDLAAFRAAGGEALLDHARFEALHAHFRSGGVPLHSWRDWPEPFRSPRSEAVAEFARAHEDEIGLHVFLQWLADRGLAAAQATARKSGMPVGIVADLAVGTDPGGSHCWIRREEMLIGPSVGAPPDLFNRLGQGWGISAFSPSAMRANGFRAFLEMLRAAFRHAGGVRIDHAMGLLRLWLVPEGATPADGAYLHFPFADLVRLIALESVRHRAIVVGEDLGTVPAGFDERVGAAGMLGMRVLWFERDWQGFKAPQDWSRQVMAMTTTHDLPTVAGWWEGRDIDWRSGLNLLGEGHSEAGEREGREREKRDLAGAFERAGLTHGPAEGLATEAVVDAAIAFVGMTPSPLPVVPLEDFLGEREQPNLPGTIAEHPNWRRRQTLPAATILDSEAPKRRLAAMRAVRSGAVATEEVP